MSVHALDRPRVSLRIEIPYHRVNEKMLAQALAMLERRLTPEADKLPSPRKQVVYLTYEEVSAWQPEPAA